MIRLLRGDLCACFIFMAICFMCAGPGFGADLIKTIPHRAIEDVVFGHKDGLALTYDVLIPEENPKNIGIILVSSGGWNSEKSAITEDIEKMRRTEHWVRGLLQGRYTIFIVRHGSRPRYRVSEMTPDILRAVRFIRLRAAEYGIDPDHLGITSGSSGGHLSLMTAFKGDDGDPNAKDPVNRVSSRVQAIVAWFPPTDLVNWGEPGGYTKINMGAGFFEEILGKYDDLESSLKSISPIYFAAPNSPPLLLLHGDADKTVPLQQSEIMKAKYDELGLPVKLVVHPNGGHTFWSGIMDDYPTVWEWFDQYLAVEAEK